MNTIKKMYEHLSWGNQRILEGLRNSGGDVTEQRRLFSHILLAEQVWVNRIKGRDSLSIQIWAELSIDECTILAKQNEEAYSDLLNHLLESDLQEKIVYKNSKGNPFTTTLHDILTHVALHGQYHRGQINTLLRRGGFEPINTDYITFVR